MDYGMLDSLLAERGMSRRRLAKLAGISVNTLSSAFRRESKNLSIENVMKIANALKVDWRELMGLGDSVQSECTTKEDKPKMKVTLIYKPEQNELMLFKRCIWVTMSKNEIPHELPSSKLLRSVLRARHSPIRVLNFGFLIEGIPSNTATHLARHVHAVPMISSLRNDRQEKIDGDNAPRNTPVTMIYYCNAEELMVIANKRLCGRAAERTREVVKMMCDEAAKAMPEIAGELVPMCVHCGGVCHEINSCGRCIKG